MIVDEEFQVFADHEHVEQLLVYDLEICNGAAVPRVVDAESEAGGLPGFEQLRSAGQVHVILDQIGKPGDQLHATPGAHTGV